jgi:hypothetical protein
VAGIGSVANSPIALGRVSLQQRGDYLTTLVGTEVAAMDVGADDVVASSSIIAREVCELRRNLNKLTSRGSDCCRRGSGLGSA